MLSKQHLLHGLLIAALASSCLPYTAQAKHHQQKHSQKQGQYEVESDLPNFHEVHPYLYRGAQPSERGYKELYDMGVRTVFNLRQTREKVETEKGICEKLGMHCIEMPMNPLEAPPEKYINKFLAAVQKSKEHPDQGSVFVHCAGGQDRTGCLVGIYRVKVDNFSFDDARAEMLRYGFHPQFKNLEASVREHSAPAPATTAN